MGSFAFAMNSFDFMEKLTKILSIRMHEEYKHEIGCDDEDCDHGLKHEINIEDAKKELVEVLKALKKVVENE